LIESLQADLGRDKVRLAYMSFTPPCIPDVAADAVQSGAKKIRVLPLFLAAQGHVDRDVGPLVEQLRQLYPAVEIELLPPVGRHPLFLEMLRQIALEGSE